MGIFRFCIILMLSVFAVWLPADGKTKAQLPTDPVRRVAWSPDGNFLAITVGKDKVEVLDLDQNIIGTLNLGLSDTVVNPIWSPNSDAIALELGTSWVNQRLVIWYFQTGTTVEVGEDIMFGEFVDDPAWSADGSRIAAVRTRTLTVLDAVTGQALHQLAFGVSANGNSISNMEWSPNGNHILVEDTRGVVNLLSGQTYDIEATFLGRGQNRVYGDIFWTASDLLFAATTPDAIYVYDSSTQEIVQTYTDPIGILIQWSGNTMVFATGIDSVTFVNSQNFQVLDEITLDVQGEWIGSVAWEPTANRIAYTLRSADGAPLPQNMVILHIQDIVTCNDSNTCQ